MSQAARHSLHCLQDVHLALSVGVEVVYGPAYIYDFNVTRYIKDFAVNY